MFNKALFLPALILSGVTVAMPAGASTIAANAMDDIYAAGQVTDPYGGMIPVSISLLPGTTSIVFGSVTGSMTCSSAEGCITINNSTLNDPDGQMAATATSSNSGTSSISGIADAPGAGYLVGLFVASGGPSGTAPAALDFTAAGIGTSFSSLSPLLDQTFFIGDGLTGDGTGTEQIFNVPTGAGTLYLGISDAGGYNGTPGAFGDNFGTYSVVYSQIGDPPSSAPEPESLALLCMGMGAVALTLALERRRRTSRS